jgi:hypothetical protein
MATVVNAPVSAAARSARAAMSEDWLAVGLGLFVFLLSLGTLAHVDVLGWVVTARTWTTPAGALAAASKAYGALPGPVSLGATYVFMLAILTVAARLLRADLRRFAVSFSVVFAASYACWFAGSWPHIAATPDKRAGLGIGWSLNLTNEAGFIVWVGLLISFVFFHGVQPSLLRG